MNAFFWGGGDPALQRLGWVLLHFVWQGALIGVVVGMAVRLAGHSSPASRYRLLCWGLGGCFLAPLVTWFVLGRVSILGSLSLLHAILPAAREATVSAGPLPRVSLAPVAPQWDLWRDQIVPAIQSCLPLLVSLWAVGIIFLSGRHGAGWIAVRRLVRAGVPVEDEQWLDHLNLLCRKMRVKPSVRLLRSAGVEAPILVGWLRPVLLVPVAFFIGLPPAQVEAIFAHELAHVLRHDFLVNLLQVGVETLLFYHPVVWWIGRELRQAREECCDDLAVTALGERRNYIAALAALEERRGELLGVTLSASGGSLLRRLRRLAFPLGEKTRPGRVAGLILVLGLAALALFGVRIAILRSHEGPSLRGQVVDETGHAVPGAEVRFCLMEGKPDVAPSRHDASADYKKIAHADGLGRFVLPDLSPAMLYTVVAVAPGHGPDYAVRIDPAVSRARLMLPRLSDVAHGVAARGHVVGPDGVPVAGAEIRPLEYHWRGTSTNGVVGEEWRVFTDEHGDFALPQTWFASDDSPASQGVSGQIMATGFAPARFFLLPYNGQPRRIVLDRGVAVMGRLPLNGAPVSGIEVGLQPANHSYGHWMYETVAMTDVSGRFLFPNVAANDAYQIYGKRASLRFFGVTHSKTIQVGGVGTALDVGVLEVFPGRTVTGSIVLSDGKALSQGPQLQLNQEDGADSFHLDLKRDGKFEFRAFDGEKLEIYSWVPGYRFHLRDPLVKVAVSPDLKPVELLYNPEPRRIPGQIVLTDGKQLSRPILVTVRREGATPLGIPVGVDGRFTFSAADGDRFSFEASVPGYEPEMPLPRADGKDGMVIKPSIKALTLTFSPQ